MKWFVSILLVTLFAPLTFAQKKLLIDVKGTSLQELMNLKITSLSKKSEPLSEAPAAVYVLTRDDIIRSGANHLPEVLRYVPGVEVARISATQWAISIRGFNSNSANKLLVMIDGRSVYSPLYSGVLWEEKDVLMEDVERIEVVRGPGGTLWGANAVNGVINIITRSAQDAEGSHIKVGAGRVERGIVQLRHEQAVTDHQFVRVYGKFTDREESPAAENDSDKGQLAIGGFRWDIVDQSWGDLMVQGDVYHSELGGGFVSATREGRDGRGHNLLLNWQLEANPKQNHKLLFYFDHTTLETSLSDRRDIWNLEYQLQQQWGRNEFVIGAGYRYLTDDVTGSELFSVAPQKRSDEIFNVFLQNDTAFQGDTLHLILGSKFEHNNYTGDEWQPSIRLAKIWGDFMVWGAWSRAIRVPSRLEHDIVSPFLTGNQTAVSEESDFYEVG
ncbi:MAG: TonB-dependent receptor plug domain-containing protein, partial [Pseudomonadales bacterium]|nr:TonB-dependent receptor plug domain-containing protein [Pseudomonadales bacterium]